MKVSPKYVASSVTIISALLYIYNIIIIYITTLDITTMCSMMKL